MANNPANISTDPWDLYYNNDFAGAEAAFRVAVGNDPTDPAALDGLAASLMQLGRMDESLQLFSKASGLMQAESAERPRNLHGWATALRMKGHLDQAETKAEQLLQIFPQAPGWYLLGLIRYDRRNFAGAEEAFRKAHDLDPTDVSAVSKLFDTLIESGQKDQALAVVSDLYELQKNSEDRKYTLRNWAVLLREGGDLPAAAAKAKELVERFKDYAAGWNTKAIIRQAGNDLDGAIDDYRKAIEVGKNAPAEERAQWLLNLGDALRKKGSKQEAIDVYQQADALDSSNPNIKNAMGLALAALGNQKDAIAQYKEAERLSSQSNSPARKYALRNWADILIDQEHPELAEPILRRAMELDPKDPDTHNKLGIVLEKRKPLEAIEQYQEADTLWSKSDPPKRVFALRNWASVLIDQQQPELAVPILRRARDLDASDADTHNTLGVALANLEPETAIREFETADSLWQKANSPKRRYALRNLADTLNAGQDYEGAEKTCRKAMAVPGDLDTPWIYNALGTALVGQGNHEAAIAEFRKAKQMVVPLDNSCRYILWRLGNALLNRERFDESLAAYKQAVDMSPATGYFGHLGYGYALASAGQNGLAFTQYELAIKADEHHPYARNNKADLLFRLGRYKEGWAAWEEARTRYEEAEPILTRGSSKPGEVAISDCLERGAYFADVLRDIFNDYDRALYWYELVLKVNGTYTPAVCGRAILLRRMSQRERQNLPLQINSSQAMREACEILETVLERPHCFEYLLVKADLLIEDRDWQRLGDILDRAQRQCGELRLRRSTILVRRGILALATDKPKDAIRFFQQALIDRTGDYSVMAYLGQALWKDKRYIAALQTFKEVLDVAPGHVESLIGSAQASIELADDGDIDRYDEAKERLDQALNFGREGGSIKLREVDLADIYYMRGYAKIKLYEADRGFRPLMIWSARDDFKHARDIDGTHGAAKAAYNKVSGQIRRRASGSVSDMVGTVTISIAAALVFVFAQLDFFFRGTWLHRAVSMPVNAVLTKPSEYATVTFAALAMMIAGLSLRKLLKLKVAGIELEKTSPDQVTPANVLDIGRFGVFEGFIQNTQRGLGTTPSDLSKRQSEGKSPEEGFHFTPEPVNAKLPES
jgi:tetratricopeptide (TPR) repeat protein